MPILIPGKYIEEAGYKIGDHVRLDVDIDSVCIAEIGPGELYLLDRYDPDEDMFEAIRVLH